jgi:hypothetical protein
MTVLGPKVVEKFCKICNWAYESWTTRQTIFDNNPNRDQLEKSLGSESLSRISTITQEYVLFQIIKLHDPAVQKGDINLTFEYIINYGGWDQETVLILNDLFSKLDKLAQYIRPARNKILSHNDLKSILDDVPLGVFPQGKDIEYFRILQEFVNVVHDKSVGDPYVFNDLAKSDAQDFLETIQKNSATVE